MLNVWSISECLRYWLVIRITIHLATRQNSLGLMLDRVDIKVERSYSNPESLSAIYCFIVCHLPFHLLFVKM